MLADQQAGRLARSDKVLMCGTIKGRTTDCILEVDPLEGPLVPGRKRFLLLWIAFLLTLLCNGMKRPMYGGNIQQINS